MGRFQDKVVLITGASGGIGKKLVDAFIYEEASVCATYYQHKPIIPNYCPPRPALVIQGDLTKAEEAARIVNECLEFFGRIDVLVNGAAITVNGFTEKLDPSDWQMVINTNLNSAFNMLRCILPLMKERKAGHIINISSVVGEIGAIGCSPYVASKAGLVGLTKAVAKETARYGIFVNALLLGYFETGLGLQFTQELKQKIAATIPLGHFGDPQEIVKAIFFLAETRYMTGATLRLSGGL